MKIGESLTKLENKSLKIWNDTRIYWKTSCYINTKGTRQRYANSNND